MLNDYKANRKRTYVDAKRRIDKHLAPFFGNKRLSSITARIRAYIAKRLADTYLAHPARRVKRPNGTSQELPEVRRPVSVGEINRELTVLKRMFSLAIEAGKLHHKPHFAMCSFIAQSPRPAPSGTGLATASPSAASIRHGGGRGRRPGAPAVFRTTSDGQPSAHGPRRDSGACGHEIERPQDSQRVRSL